MQISSHDCENFKANTFPVGAVIHQRQYHSQQGANNCFGKLCASTLLLPSAPCYAELGCTPLPFAPKSKHFGEIRMNGVHIAKEVWVPPRGATIIKIAHASRSGLTVWSKTERRLPLWAAARLPEISDLLSGAPDRTLVVELSAGSEMNHSVPQQVRSSNLYQNSSSTTF